MVYFREPTFNISEPIGNVFYNIRELLSKTKSVIDYHIEFREGNFNRNLILVIRLWVKKSEYEEQKVAEILSGGKMMEEKIKTIANGVGLSVKFDIYKK